MVAVFVAAGACRGGRSPVTVPTRATNDCVVQAAPESPPDSLLVATTASVRPGRMIQAPNAGERFVLAHAYESIVLRDCTGRLRPGLATAWRASNAGYWEFMLRAGAHFWNGDPADAQAVIESWRAAGALTHDSIVARVAATARALDARTLTVQMLDPSVLATPPFAVMRVDANGGWPEGTGAYRVRAVAPDNSRGDVLRLEPVAPGALPPITIRSGSPAVARDALDAGVDVLLTNDRAVIAYAAAAHDVHSFALPPDRTYLLVAHPLTAAPRDTATSAPAPTDDATQTLRVALARDAVALEARATTSPYWWTASAGCALPAGATSTPERPLSSPNILYRSDDPIARGLAQRLAALGGMRDSVLLGSVPAALARLLSRAVAVGLDSLAFERARARGEALAFILFVPRQSLTPCEDLAQLAGTMPEFARQDSMRGTPAIIPLVDAYWRVFVRRGRVGATVDGTGALRLTMSPAAGAPVRP